MRTVVVLKQKLKHVCAREFSLCSLCTEAYSLDTDCCDQKHKCIGTSFGNYSVIGLCRLQQQNLSAVDISGTTINNLYIVTVTSLVCIWCILLLYRVLGFSRHQGVPWSPRSSTVREGTAEESTTLREQNSRDFLLSYMND